MQVDALTAGVVLCFSILALANLITWQGIGDWAVSSLLAGVLYISITKGGGSHTASMVAMWLFIISGSALGWHIVYWQLRPAEYFAWKAKKQARCNEWRDARWPKKAPEPQLQTPEEPKKEPLTEKQVKTVVDLVQRLRIGE